MPRRWILGLFVLLTFCSKVSDNAQVNTKKVAVAPASADATGEEDSAFFLFQPIFTTDPEAMCREKTRTIWTGGKCLDIMDSCRASAGYWDSRNQKCALRQRVTEQTCEEKNLQWKDGSCQIFEMTEEREELQFAPKIEEEAVAKIETAPVPEPTASSTDTQERQKMWEEIFGNAASEDSAIDASSEPNAPVVVTTDSTPAPEAVTAPVETASEPVQQHLAEPTPEPVVEDQPSVEEEMLASEDATVREPAETDPPPAEEATPAPETSEDPNTSSVPEQDSNSDGATTASG